MGGDLRHGKVLAEGVQSAEAGDGLQAADAGGDRPFTDSFDQADLAGGGRVRAAAEFRGEAVGELDHADLVTVLLSEERHGVVLVDGHVDGHVFEGFHTGVGQHLAVDDGLDLLEFLIGHLGKVRKVETQPRGLDQRSGLLHVRAQHLAERGVEQVRSGVVAADGIAALAIDDGVDTVAEGQRLLEQSLVGADALDGQHATLNLGGGCVAVG